MVARARRDFVLGVATLAAGGSLVWYAATRAAFPTAHGLVASSPVVSQVFPLLGLLLLIAGVDRLLR